MNPKQKWFAEEYILDLNATQAAIRAGYAKGSADVTGARLLGNASVAKVIQKAQKERSERTKIDADWVLKRLVEEADADLADLYDENDKLKHLKDWPLIWRKGLVTGVKTDRTKTGDDDELVTVDEIKLSDRIKRIELIGKHIDVQAFKDKTETEVKGGAISELIDLIQSRPNNNIRDVVARKRDPGTDEPG